MALESLAELTDEQKAELVAALSVLIAGSVEGVEEISSENVKAVAEASGNKLSDAYATLFSSVATKAGGVSKFCAAPGSGGGGGGGGGGGDGGGDAAAVEEKEEEEEEEMDMSGGMSMFGDEDGGGGDY